MRLLISSWAVKFQMQQIFSKLVDKTTAHLTDDGKTELIKSLSGVYIAKQFPKETPILLLHGTDDDRVLISNSEAMPKELTRLHHPHKLQIIESGGHISLKDGSYKEIDKLRKAWLERYF